MVTLTLFLVIQLLTPDSAGFNRNPAARTLNMDSSVVTLNTEVAAATLRPRR